MTLINPWVIVGGLVSFIGAFLFGMHVEHQRFEAFVAKVQVEGERAAIRNAERMASEKRLKEQSEEQHARNETTLRGQLDDLRVRLRNSARPTSSVVPAAPKPAASGDERANRQLCFNRERLREGLDGGLERFAERLDRLAERYQALTERGAKALNDLNTCAGWAKSLAPL